MGPYQPGPHHGCPQPYQRYGRKSAETKMAPKRPKTRIMGSRVWKNNSAASAMTPKATTGRIQDHEEACGGCWPGCNQIPPRPWSERGSSRSAARPGAAARATRDQERVAAATPRRAMATAASTARQAATRRARGGGGRRGTRRTPWGGARSLPWKVPSEPAGRVGGRAREEGDRREHDQVGRRAHGPLVEAPLEAHRGEGQEEAQGQRACEPRVPRAGLDALPLDPRAAE